MTVINLDYIVYNDRLEPLIENDKPVTSRNILSNVAYFASNQEHKNENSKKYADMHIRFVTEKDGQIDLTREEISLLEKAIETNTRFPGVSGQILYLLDGKDMWEKIHDYHQRDAVNASTE